MTTLAYSEDQLVEQPAIGLFAALGWSTVCAMDELFGPAGTGSKNRQKSGFPLKRQKRNPSGGRRVMKTSSFSKLTVFSICTAADYA